jgi:hypothetical protein
MVNRKTINATARRLATMTEQRLPKLPPPQQAKRLRALEQAFRQIVAKVDGPPSSPE